MKYRLQRDYPNSLTIHPSKSPRVSELVTCHDAMLSDIVHDAMIPTEKIHLPSTEASSTEDWDTTQLLSSDHSGDSSIFQSHIPTIPDPKIEMFHCAHALRAAIAESQAQVGHPPTPAEFSMENCKQAVPPVLFNFMCLMTGLIDMFPDDLADYASVKSSMKVMSLCQDIVGLAGNTNPKALALGLTVRHATGSSHLIRLLHGLGHTPSYDTILRAETALAYQQAANQEHSYIPQGFESRQPTVLVYDNIDFLEETLSGAGTTHHTNGIMFQLAPSGSTITRTRKVKVPGSKKTFTPTKSDIPAFHLINKQSPHQVAVPSSDIARFKESVNTDRNYLLLKLSENPSPGTWTGVNIKTSQPLSTSSLHYLPIIEASPTEMATVKHILMEAIRMADTLECPSVMVVFDQAIYHKAQVIRWADTSIQQRLLPRLGELHTIMSYLSAVGKRMEKSGFEDLLVEAEVIAAGSMKGVLSGHMYNRSIRAHKLMFEALGLLQLREFVECCDHDQLQQLEDAIHMLELRLSTGSSLSSDASSKFLSDFQTHITERCAESPLYQFWNSYLDMISVVLSFIRATRTADFALHMSSLRQMLPWFFAYDRVNYSR